MLSRLLSLTRKEFLQFSRDWPVIFLVFYLFVEPVLCGVSIFLDVKHMPLAVYDADRTQASRALITQLAISEHFDIYAVLDSQAGLEPLFDTGEARVGLIIPNGFGRVLAQGNTARVQLIADGSDSYSATVAIGYAEQIIGAHSRRIELERLGVPEETALAGLPVVVNRFRARYDPDLDYTNFIMVTMVALLVILLPMILGSSAIVREKERGTLEQVMVTPTRPWELIGAKLLPLGIIKMIGLAVAMAISIWGFRVPVNGSLGLYFALSIITYLVGAGLGIAIGTVANNSHQSLLLVFFLMFPMIFLSGFFTPVFTMPLVLQWLTALNPLYYFNTITIGVFFKGVGMDVLWPPAAALGVLAVVIFSGSLANFRRSIA